MANDMSFKLDISDFLGVDHAAYIRDLESLSIARPSDYNRVRNSVSSKLKKDLLTNTYVLYYNLLTTGSEFPELVALGLKPSYPKQKASEFALGGAEALNKVLDEVMEIVLPANAQGFAQQQLKRKAATSNIDI
jgi:hypothetical protein